MLCYYFPPIGGAGTQRSSKLVKYLPRYGWMPTVIAGIDYTWPQDRTLLADIPEGVEVHRLPLPVSVWRRARHWMFGHRLGPVGWGQLANRLGWFLDFPCTKREWADTAAEMALHLCQYHSFDAIYASIPPFSLCSGIRRVQKELGIPWLLDFRDPWAGGKIGFDNLPAWLRRKHARAERDAVLHADAIACAHPALAEALTRDYNLPAARCHVVFNGYDPDDFAHFPPLPSGTGRKCTFTHTGTLYSTYNADALAKALRDHWSGPPAGTEEVEFRFVGGAGETVFPEKRGLKVTVTPRVDHHTALHELAQANVLLTTFDRRLYKTNISGKLFEYLASGRPILGILPADGTMADIIRECRAGWVADCDQPAQIVETIHDVVRQVTQPGFRFEPDWDRVKQYSRAAQAGRMAAVLNQMVSQPGVARSPLGVVI